MLSNVSRNADFFLLKSIAHVDPPTLESFPSLSSLSLSLSLFLLLHASILSIHASASLLRASNLRASDSAVSRRSRRVSTFSLVSSQCSRRWVTANGSSKSWEIACSVCDFFFRLCDKKNPWKIAYFIYQQRISHVSIVSMSLPIKH